MCLTMPRPIRITDGFKPFCKPADRADLDVRFTEVSQLPPPPENELFRNLIFAVYESGDTYLRYYHDHRDADRPYAVTTYDWDRGVAEIQYLSGDERFFSESLNSFSHIGFEELLISRNRLNLHASLIDTPFGGILFSGPSGIGKSTQADLWKKYEGSTIINGDRPILSRSKEGWLAHGSPYAGSSRCYCNESVSITAIVMLEQGKNCTIRRLSTADAFRRLYGGTVVNSWNERYVTSVCDLLLDLASSVPVYHFVCTPDKDAVEALKSVLSKGED